MKKKDILKLSDMELDRKVKIQGTEYDRKRTVTDKTINKMIKMLKKGDSAYKIAQKMGVSYRCVRYNTDPVYKYMYNKNRSGKHTGVDRITTEDRILYKRMLVKQGKVSV